MLNRSLEKEIMPCCKAHKVGVIPWGPLAGGILSGKYQRAETAPADTRVGKMALYHADFSQASFDKLDALKEFARERNRTLPEIAVAWLLANPVVSTVIAGATKIEQVSGNAAGVEYKITPEDLEILNKITEDKTGEIAFGDQKPVK
jgi:aryl-alcohol dehydrogenase-like predicted oxidoreductase